MVQFVLTGKLVFLKKLLDHVRKYKFDIHRRILGVIMVFFLKAFKMSPELFYILAGDILRNRLHKLRILHFSDCHAKHFILIGKHMLVRMIEFLLHLLFQLLQNRWKTFTSVKLPAHGKIKPLHVLTFQEIIDMICHKLIIAVHILEQNE